MRPLDGRAALVTGAGSGGGRGIALALASAGAAVTIAARRRENGEQVAEEVRTAGGRALCCVGDVSTVAAVRSAVSQTMQAFGSLDIVVHNAVHGSSGMLNPIESVTDEFWENVSGVSLLGSYLIAKEALPFLARDRGRLIFLTSTSGMEGSAQRPVYSCVKGAQRALAKSLAREWGPRGITVNCISPVAISEQYKAWATENPEQNARVLARIPLGRLGDAQTDIGPVAVFLASDAARFVTGQTILADGGGYTGH